MTGVVMTSALGVVGVALLHLLAWGSARTTIYTLTNRRIVLRIGMAVPKCINLPLGMIASVDLAARADGTGDVPLTLLGAPKLGYARCGRTPAPWQHRAAAADAARGARCRRRRRADRAHLPRRQPGRADRRGRDARRVRCRPSPRRRRHERAHDHADMLPRGTLMLAGALVLFALAATSIVRIAGIPARRLARRDARRRTRIAAGRLARSCASSTVPTARW